MKYTAVLALFAFAPAVMSQLMPRACEPSDCTCGCATGLFCGDESVNSACTNGHVFQCNADTGASCDYGPRDSCSQCGELHC